MQQTTTSLRGIRQRLRKHRLGESFARLLARFAPAKAELFSLPERVAKPEGSRIVVFAPHPDDETLGCGGTLRQHQLAGDSITAVFVTDGRMGRERFPGLTPDELVAVRETEAREAARLLGIRECIFLRNPDTQLEVTGETIAQARRIIETLQPDLLYLPSPFESHRDHQRTCAIVARALDDGAGAPRICLYEVWTPLLANLIVPIDLDYKIRVIQVYRSQLDERQQYVAAASCLARYRGMSCLYSLDTPAECFLRCDRATLLGLVAGDA